MRDLKIKKSLAYIGSRLTLGKTFKCFSHLYIDRYIYIHTSIGNHTLQLSDVKLVSRLSLL